MAHDFKKALEWSMEASAEPFWNAVYAKAFSNMVKHMPVTEDGEHQRMGIDRVVFLSNGKTLYIDEKKRRKVYPDILLEYISVDKYNKVGWIEKNLPIDYLAYAFMPTSQCYLFNWPLLRRAWLHYGNEWKDKYFTSVAQNHGYQTHSLAVPITVLCSAVKQASIIDVSKEIISL